MHHLIRLHGRVDRAMAETVKKRFETIKSGHAVYFHIKSAGGELKYAREIADLILAKRTEIQMVGIGYGEVHSSALHIFVACTYRIGYSQTRYLLHLPKSDGSEQGDRGVFLAQQEEVEYFAKMTNKDKSLIFQLMTQETYLTNRLAASLGVINFDIEKKSLLV